jgi:hypothetical protein
VTSRLALAAALLALGAVPASAQEATSYYSDCGTALAIKPRTITVFCADGGMVVQRIRWSRWNQQGATGTSRRALVNDCEPSCADGTVHRYRVRLKLSRPQACANGQLAFRRLSATFTGRKPRGPRTINQRTGCPTG